MPYILCVIILLEGGLFLHSVPMLLRDTLMSYISIIPHLSYLFAIIKGMSPFIHSHIPSFLPLKDCVFHSFMFLFEMGGDRNWIRCSKCGCKTDLHILTTMFSTLFSGPFLVIPSIPGGFLVCFALLLN